MIEVKLENYDDFIRCVESDPTQFVVVGTPYHQTMWKDGREYVEKEGMKIWVKLTSVGQSFHSRMIYSHAYTWPMLLPISTSVKHLEREKASLRERIADEFKLQDYLVFYGAVITDAIEGE